MAALATLSEAGFETCGAMHLPGAVTPILSALLDWSDRQPPDRAGVRLTGAVALHAHLSTQGMIGCIAAKRIGAGARPVRAVLFDKSQRTNWSLAWHQDRTICVRERREVAGFGPWTVKAGILHVAPPITLLEGMVTLRVHLDAVPNDNAPLLIAPGSHRLGLVREAEVTATVARHGSVARLAEAVDVWAYSTPILHASAAAGAPQRRRVLQVDYAACDLPDRLEWLGV